MEKAGREAELVPSLTLMTIPGYVPTFAAAGVPARVPVALLKVSQAGRLETLNVSAAPLGSPAVGVKL